MFVLALVAVCVGIFVPGYTTVICGIIALFAAASAWALAMVAEAVGVFLGIFLRVIFGRM
jgi:hypothetical protein